MGNWNGKLKLEIGNWDVELRIENDWHSNNGDEYDICEVEHHPNVMDEGYQILYNVSSEYYATRPNPYTEKEKKKKMHNKFIEAEPALANSLIV